MTKFHGHSSTKIFIPILIPALFLFTGCLFGGSNTTARRGSLSDVMEKSSDDYEGDRVVHTEGDRPWEDFDCDNDVFDPYVDVKMRIKIIHFFYPNQNRPDT